MLRPFGAFRIINLDLVGLEKNFHLSSKRKRAFGVSYFDELLLTYYCCCCNGKKEKARGQVGRKLSLSLSLSLALSFCHFSKLSLHQKQIFILENYSFYEKFKIKVKLKGIFL